MVLLALARKDTGVTFDDLLVFLDSASVTTALAGDAPEGKLPRISAKERVSEGHVGYYGNTLALDSAESPESKRA